MKKIAITGGIATGKSSVCQIFKELGAFTVSADAVVHDLLNPSTDLGKKITVLLHIENSSDRPEVFRKAIADKVFEDRKLLQELENILHPEVCKEIRRQYERIKSQKYTYFVVEIPLLFEIHDEHFYDVVITVLADEEIARKRFTMQGFSKEDFERRMRRQMSPKEKAARATFTILNNGSLEDLRQEVIKIQETKRFKL